MKSIDTILILGTITIASCLVIFPKRIHGILRPLVALTTLLAIVQFLHAGYYWQNIPGYLLPVLLFLTGNGATRAFYTSLTTGLASHIFKFGNIPTRTHHATVDILKAFFDDALNDKLPDLDSIAGHHPGIIGH